MMKSFRIFLASIFLLSCNIEARFDKVKWHQPGDLGIYPHRKSMLKDLTRNYRLTGLSYRQLIDLLGKPDRYNAKESELVEYNIETEYGNDIDPVYVKSLELKLTQDSTVESFIVKEWKK
ncbi:MAG: hypothetical protein EOO89_21955 [Pedobacter sp.]|nr:MAG: hypothetical protein EOO89_21955 [Pedobacter sp.]